MNFPSELIIPLAVMIGVPSLLIVCLKCRKVRLGVLWFLGILGGLTVVSLVIGFIALASWQFAVIAFWVIVCATLLQSVISAGVAEGIRNARR